MAQSVLFDTLPYTSRKHVFRNREETENSNVLVFKNSRIGIGTQEPEENYRVTISGNTVIRGTLTADILSFTASNQNHITIDNLGTKESLNIIQRGYDPFITFRSNESEIVNIIDGNGNIGIGTSIAYQPLIVNGKIVVEDILLTGESIYQTRFQLPPIRETFIVSERADIDFMVSINGLYAASNDDVEVYLNGYKLAYYNSNQLDYTVSFSNEYEPPKSYFNITLTSIARAGDVIDITIWPTTLDNVQEGGTLGGYSTQSIYSYWNRALDKSVYYTSGNVGVGTNKPLYAMDVRGISYADRFKGDGSLLSNVPGFTIQENRSMFYLNGNIGIGTTYAREKLHVQGSVYIDKTLYTSNLVVFINSNITTNYIYDIVSIDTSNYGSGISINNYGSNFAFYVSQNDNIDIAAFYYNETSNAALYIGSNGNIGIGTNQPLYNLHVVGNSFMGGSLILDNENINIGTGTVTASSFLGTATQVSQNLIRGSYLTGDNYNGSVAVTWEVDADSANTPSKIVVRDASGDFSAGTITANLTGTATQVSQNLIRGFYLTGDNYNGSVAITWGVDATTTSEPDKIVARDALGTIYASNIAIGTTEYQLGKLVVDGNIVPSACNVYDLGTSNLRFRDIYLSGNSIDLGGTRITRDETTKGINIIDEVGNFVNTNVSTLYASNIYNQGNLGIGTTTIRQTVDIIGNTIISGNLGVGTENPLYTLHINGTLSIGSNYTDEHRIKGSVYQEITSSNTTHIANTLNYSILSDVLTESRVQKGIYYNFDNHAIKPNANTMNVYGLQSDINNAIITTDTASLNQAFGLYSRIYNYASNDTYRTITNAQGTRNLIENVRNGIITNAYGNFNSITNTSDGSIANTYGTYNSITNSKSGILSDIKALYNVVNNASNGTITTMHGIHNSLTNSDGEIQNIYGNRTEITNNLGTVDNLYGNYTAIVTDNNDNDNSVVYGNYISINTTSSFLNNPTFGLYIEYTDFDTISKKYGIYSLDEKYNTFTGNVGIGLGYDVDPVEKLHVKGNALISGNVGIGTTNPVAILDISAGTTTKAPVNIRTGTLLTTSNEGSIEFNGVNMYHTISATTGRSIIETPYFYVVPTAGITLDNSISALNIFNRGFNVLPHTYEFMGQCYLSRIAGELAHTIDFILGGNATIDTDGLSYSLSICNSTSDVIPPNSTNMYTYWRTTTSSTITNSISSPTEYTLIKFNGIVRFSAIGQFTPQIQYSAAPGGTTIVSKNSYIKIYPLGARTVEYQGQWI